MFSAYLCASSKTLIYIYIYICELASHLFTDEGVTPPHGMDYAECWPLARPLKA